MKVIRDILFFIGDAVLSLFVGCYLGWRAMIALVGWIPSARVLVGVLVALCMAVLVGRLISAAYLALTSRRKGVHYGE